MDDMSITCEDGEELMCIDGIVYDVSLFKGRHAGGSVISHGIRPDASALFHSEAYKHSNAARNPLGRMRKARLEGEMACCNHSKDGELRYLDFRARLGERKAPHEIDSMSSTVGKKARYFIL